MSGGGGAGSNRGDWRGRSCLVTGGAGFGGSHLSAELVARGAKVHVLDRVLPRNSYLVLEGVSERVEFIHGDVRDLELLRLTIERYQIHTIFHLAAQPLVVLSNVLPLETLSVNALGTFRVLEAMRTGKVAKALVFASSGAHYGLNTTDRPIAEDETPGPAANLYGASKTAAEVAVRAYAHVYGLNTVACRFMNTYGPGDSNTSRLVPRAVKNLLSNVPYEFGERDDGTTRLDFLHIRDMTRAYLSAAEHIESVRGEAFNFGTGKATNVADVARQVSRIFDGREREPLFHGTQRETPIVKCLDIAKAERLLGWRPAIDLDQGLAETLAWYQRFE